MTEATTPDTSTPITALADIPGITHWKRVTEFPGKLQKDIVRSYINYIPDFDGIIGFMNLLRSSLVFVSDYGWIAVTNFRRNLSAEIHGAMWADKHRKAADADTINEVIGELLDYIISEANLIGINAHIVEHAKGMESLLTNFGFKGTGVIPIHDTYDSVPRSIHIYTYSSG